MTRIQIDVEGMHCTGCERAVSSGLERLEGVREAQADHEAARVRVSFDPERVGEDELRQRIEETGYRPR